MAELSHLTAAGDAHMVDVGDKVESRRSATAEAVVQLSSASHGALMSGTAPKGDVLAVVRIAAIQAAKKTPDLIPLCHPLPISKVSVDIDVDDIALRVSIRATVQLTGKTGVEMEALTAASIGALTLYDMLKGIDKGIEIIRVRLLRKSGGKSGDFHADG
jgi:cyclic pyranopterin monophosphate synthase